MKTQLIVVQLCLLSLLLCFPQQSKALTKTTLLQSSVDSSLAKKQLVILGEGFRAGADQQKYNQYIQSHILQGVFAQPPFVDSMNAFDIFRINAESADSGITRQNEYAEETVKHNTAFEYYFSGRSSDCWIQTSAHTQSRIHQVLARLDLMPDYVIVIVNEKDVGGCRTGNQLVFTMGVSVSNILYEFAHMIGVLCPPAVAINSVQQKDSSCINLISSINSKFGADAPDELLDQEHNGSLLLPHQDFVFTRTLTGDFNGDGRTEFIIPGSNMLSLYTYENAGLHSVKNYTGNIPGAAPWTLRAGDHYTVADFDGDGKDDLYVRNTRDWKSHYIALLRSNGQGFEVRMRYRRTPEKNEIHTASSSVRDYSLDFDGDGKQDLIQYGQDVNGNSFLQMFRSTGTELEPVRTYQGHLPGWKMAISDRLLVGDIDGDGRQDLYLTNTLGRVAPALAILRSTGSGFSLVKHYEGHIDSLILTSRDQFYVGDINGDSRADLYLIRIDSAAALTTLLSDGHRLHQAAQINERAGKWEFSRGDRFLVADFDGDGADDLIVWNTQGAQNRRVGWLAARERGQEVHGIRVVHQLPGWEFTPGDRLMAARFNGGKGASDLVLVNAGWLGLVQQNRVVAGGSALQVVAYFHRAIRVKAAGTAWW